MQLSIDEEHSLWSRRVFLRNKNSSFLCISNILLFQDLANAKLSFTRTIIKSVWHILLLVGLLINVIYICFSEANKWVAPRVWILIEIKIENIKYDINEVNLYWNWCWNWCPILGNILYPSGIPTRSSYHIIKLSACLFNKFFFFSNLWFIHLGYNSKSGSI